MWLFHSYWTLKSNYTSLKVFIWLPYFNLDSPYENFLAGVGLQNSAVWGCFHWNVAFHINFANPNVFTLLCYSLNCSFSLKLCQPNCIHLAFLVSVYKLQLDQMVSFSAGGALIERNSSWSKINALNQQQFNCREKLWFCTSVELPLEFADIV